MITGLRTLVTLAARGHAGALSAQTPARILAVNPDPRGDALNLGGSTLFVARASTAASGHGESQPGGVVSSADYFDPT